MSVESHEGQRWPVPPADATYVMRRCGELRRVPIADLTVEDMRLLLSQQVGVDAVLPRALAVLVEAPLVEGDYYPGDLLHAVVRLPEAAWRQTAVHRRRLQQVLEATETSVLPPTVQAAVSAFVAVPQRDATDTRHRPPRLDPAPAAASPSDDGR